MSPVVLLEIVVPVEIGARVTEAIFFCCRCVLARVGHWRVVFQQRKHNEFGLRMILPWDAL